ncbi:hypothetical protein GGR51DRAFT_554202 [Nemania sp. FL0031]|nr:hypothetical protein GGR51DRAFT_554202 [Nemania sp. FL0031]
MDDDDSGSEQNRELRAFPEDSRHELYLSTSLEDRAEDEERMSLLIFIRDTTRETVSQAVSNALKASDTTIDYDYFPEDWIPLYGNQEAANLIKEHDFLSRLLNRLTECFGLTWPLDIDDPDLCWLSQMLQEHFGNSEAWCGPKDDNGHAFQQNSVRDIMTRILDYVDQWRFAQSMHHDQEWLRVGRDTKSQKEYERWMDIIDWLHKPDLYGDALLADMPGNPFKDDTRPHFRAYNTRMFEEIYGFGVELANDIGQFANNDDRHQPRDIRAIFHWLSAYINRVQTWREDVFYAMRSARGVREGRYMQYLPKFTRWLRRVEDAYALFRICAQRMVNERKNDPHQITLATYMQMQYIITGLNALIASSKEDHHHVEHHHQVRAEDSSIEAEAEAEAEVEAEVEVEVDVEAEAEAEVEVEVPVVVEVEVDVEAEAEVEVEVAVVVILIVCWVIGGDETPRPTLILTGGPTLLYIEYETTQAQASVVRTRKAVYHVKRLNPLSEADAAFISGAVQQQSENNEDEQPAEVHILDRDIYDDLDDGSVLDDLYQDKPTFELPFEHPFTIMSPKERLNQAIGTLTRVGFQANQVRMALAAEGTTEIGDFDDMLEALSETVGGESGRQAAQLGPEWSPNRRRDQPYVPKIDMNELLDLEGMEMAAIVARAVEIQA